MCAICGKPNYVKCECGRQSKISAPVGFCFQKYDLSCVFYNLDPREKNNLKTINLPNGTDLKTVIDHIDILFGRIPQQTASLPISTPAPAKDIYVAVDNMDTSGGYLSDKLEAGDNITFIILNPGGNENIQINAINNKVSVDASDPPDYLIYQISGETGCNDIATINIVKVNETLVLVPETNISNLLNAITNLPNFQNQFCALVNNCLPNPPIPPPVPPPATCLAPSNLTGSISNGTAVLNWTPPGGNGMVVVQYKLHSQPSYSTFTTVSTSTSTVSIPGLTSNVSYDFKIYTDCGNGTVSSPLVITEIEIDCPVVSVSSTTTTVTVSFPPLGEEISSYLVVLLDSTGTITISSKLEGEPFSNPISAVFSGLTPGTSYLIQVQASNGTSTNTTCSFVPITTVDLPSCLGPSNLNVTVTGTTATVTWTPDSSASFQSLYYGLQSGITGNPPGNGWTAYSGNPLLPTVSSATLPGLTAGDAYEVALNSNCQNGNVTPYLTKDFTVPNIISGTITVEQGAGAGANQNQVKLVFNFDSPTTVPITFYIGELDHNSISNTHFYGSGYDIFTLPAGYSPSTFYSTPSSPWVVNVPSGSSSFTINPLTQVIPSASETPHWVYGFNSPNDIQLTDIYITAHSPAGLTLNFTLLQSPNTGTTITLHNM